MGKLVTFLLLIVSFVIPAGQSPAPARAHSIANEPPGFTPATLISDADFVRSDSMSANAINDFLASHGSWLANYIIPEYINVTYFCKNSSNGNIEIRYVNNVRQVHVNGTPLYGMRVADLIAERSKANGLNPQVLLVLLQRESTAIQRSAPSSDTTRAWPLFYGFNDTMKDFGYSCDSSTPSTLASDYGGLGQQIAYAAFSLKNRYNNATDWNTSSCSWNPPITDNGACFTPTGRGTRALYVYTPAVHTGNHNFWYYFTIWFGGNSQPTNRFRLIKGSGDNLYFHDPATNIRLYFSSMADIQAWGLNPASITTISDSELNNITNAGQITRLIKGSGEEVYYVENGHRHHIRSAGSFSHYGLSWNNLSTIPNAILDQTPYGPPIGGLLRGKTDPDVYLLSNGRKWYIPNAFVMRAWGYDWRDIDVLPDSLTYPYQRANLEILVKGQSTPQVYAMSGGKRYYIPDTATFQHFGFDWGNLAVIGEETKVSFAQGPTLSRLVKGSGSNVYVIENSRKRYVPSNQALASYGMSWNQLIQISDELLNIYPTGAPLK